MPNSRNIIKLFLCSIFFSVTISAQTTDTIVDKLKDSTSINLKAVEVKGERPLVKAIDGKLQYDIPRMIKNKAVDNAFEVLGQVPGVMVIADNVSMVGTSSMSILINNRPSQLTYDQLIRFLKSTSPLKVRKIELMYSTPPQYGVKGASINVILENDKTLKDRLTGEVAINERQAYYLSHSGWLDMAYGSGKISTNLSYSNRYSNTRDETDIDASQVINNTLYLINQTQRAKSSSLSNDLRGVVEYETTNKRHLTLSYSGSFGNSSVTKTPTTFYVNRDTVSSFYYVKTPKTLHSVRFDYVGINGLTWGGDYMYFKESNEQNLNNVNTQQTKDSIASSSLQQSQKGSIYANMTHKLGTSWRLNYGINASISQTTNQQATSTNNVYNPTASFIQTQREVNSSTFVGISKDVGEKLSIQASLSAEYNKAIADSVKQQTTLWERVDIYPSLNIGYTANDKNNFQFSFWSGKSYPSFFQTSTSITYLNDYALSQGNPLLVPSRTYSANLNYILKSKYIFSAFADHEPGSVEQMPYQMKDSLRMIFNSINMDIRNSYGLSVVFPFKVGTVVDTKITSTAQFVRHKGTLVDIDFDNKKIQCSLSTNNTIYLTKKQNLFFTVDGLFFITPAAQGIYTIDPLWTIDCAFVWKFANDKARLSLKGNDIFKATGVYAYINQVGQHSDYFVFRDQQAISINFKYSFGDFKKKDVEKVDTSRLGNKEVK